MKQCLLDSIHMEVEHGITWWKREVKAKIREKIQKRLADDLKGKSKARTIQKGKWQMKEYIKNGNTDDI